MGVHVLSAHDVGNDVLLVTGTVDGVCVPDPAGKPTDELQVVTARGWVSALTNHTNEERPEGKKATRWKAREMTDVEKLAYCEQLLLDEVELVSAMKPDAVDLGISSPG